MSPVEDENRNADRPQHQDHRDGTCVRTVEGAQAAHGQHERTAVDGDVREHDAELPEKALNSCEPVDRVLLEEADNDPFHEPEPDYDDAGTEDCHADAVNEPVHHSRKTDARGLPSVHEDRDPQDYADACNEDGPALELRTGRGLAKRGGLRRGLFAVYPLSLFRGVRMPNRIAHLRPFL